MIILEDYFARRKQGDKINEFDLEKKEENMARCIQYIADYFEAYIDGDHGENKANPAPRRKALGGTSISAELVGYPDIMTAKMISEHLLITPQHVYNLMRLDISAGGIPSFSIGRSRRARKDEYLTWLSRRLTNSRPGLR